MIILSLRTDKPEAEIGLYNDDEQRAYITWPAHRELAETLHQRISDMLKEQQKTWQDIEAIVCFQGPGSFTGLRIGLTVANTLAYSLKIPIIASQDPNWLETGIEQIRTGQTNNQAMPFYGAEAHITPQKK